MGVDCSEKHCPDNCNNNGVCDKRRGICKCHNTFSGRSCNKRVCNYDCS
ncbi:MAG: hypothetical protein GY861_25440, partial [bacterium]|nr:hypothetical protein [bacterium]